MIIITTIRKRVVLSFVFIIVVVLSILVAVLLPKLLMNKKGDDIGMSDQVKRNTKPYEPSVLASDGAYTWWTKALAIRYVDVKDKTYISYINSNGNMMVGSMDHKTGKKEYFSLAKYERDDHNSASLAVLPNGKILAIYARHNADNKLRWRISSKKEDISNFSEEKVVLCSNVITYIQIHKINDNEYRVFYRVGSSNWGTRVYNYITDEWTDEVIWLKEPRGGQYYLWSQEAADGTIDMFMTSHPINGRDQNIYYCYFDKEGNIYKVEGDKVANLNEKSTLPIEPRDIDLVYKAKGKESTRLFDVSYMGDGRGVLFGVFTNVNDCVYKYCFYDNNTNSWSIKDVVHAGLPVEDPPGRNFYFGGLVFAKGDINTLYVSRENEGTWYIEKWETKNNGDSWVTTLLDKSSEFELFRPQCPYNSHDDIDVFYIKGNYITYMDFDTDIIMIAE